MTTEEYEAFERKCKLQSKSADEILVDFNSTNFQVVRKLDLHNDDDLEIFDNLLNFGYDEIIARGNLATKEKRYSYYDAWRLYGTCDCCNKTDFALLSYESIISYYASDSQGAYDCDSNTEGAWLLKRVTK